MNPIMLKSYKLEKNGKSRQYGLFKCVACGKEFETRMERISFMTGSCGSCSNRISGEKRKVHGMNNKNSRIHVTWSNMKRRCLNPRGKEKDIYIGIILCKEWEDFPSFYNWALDNGYTDKMTIDRIDPAKGYFPENCRFSDYSTQSANRKITGKNRSGYIGVSFEKGGWVASVQWRKVQNYIGRFKTAIDAAMARDKYVIDNELPHTLNIKELKNN